ncbi:MAG: hypothetical protein OXG61_13535 [Chloroflexi bacterium]|nr:hypothetical protein [Chloroflexota bacterium]
MGGAWTATGHEIEPLLTARTFGIAYFASILGAIAIISQSGQIVSPIIAGAIFDATGEYDWALVMFACTMGLSLLLYWLAWKLPRPELPVVSVVTSGAGGEGGEDAGQPAGG